MYIRCRRVPAALRFRRPDRPRVVTPAISVRKNGRYSKLDIRVWFLSIVSWEHRRTLFDRGGRPCVFGDRVYADEVNGSSNEAQEDKEFFKLMNENLQIIARNRGAHVSLRAGESGSHLHPERRQMDRPFWETHALGVRLYRQEALQKTVTPRQRRQWNEKNIHAFAGLQLASRRII